jgi:hypothetical protein
MLEKPRVAFCGLLLLLAKAVPDRNVSRSYQLQDIRRDSLYESFREGVESPVPLEVPS